MNLGRKKAQDCDVDDMIGDDGEEKQVAAAEDTGMNIEV